MTKEKPLSEKEFKSNVHKDLDWYSKDDVKEAVERLKIAIVSYHGQDINKLQEEIDEIFGEFKK